MNLQSGQHIRWKEHEGYINFIDPDYYLTLCIREYVKCEEDQHRCKRRTNQVCIVVPTQYWNEIEIVNENA